MHAHERSQRSLNRQMKRITSTRQVERHQFGPRAPVKDRDDNLCRDMDDRFIDREHLSTALVARTILRFVSRTVPRDWSRGALMVQRSSVTTAVRLATVFHCEARTVPSMPIVSEGISLAQLAAAQQRAEVAAAERNRHHQENGDEVPGLDVSGVHTTGEYT